MQANATSYEDTSIIAGAIYKYRVQAFNAFGVSGYTNISIFELPVPISYEDWIARYFQSAFLSERGVDPGKTLTAAGLPNLLCYAHGINPFQPDYSLLAKPRLANIQGRVVRTIERAVFKYSIGVKTVLLESSDLVHWTPCPFEAVTTAETSLHRWERITLPDSSSNHFYKLQVSLDQKTNILTQKLATPSSAQ